MKKPLRGGIAELLITSFDGRDLKGRVLLGATVDPLMVHRLLVAGNNVELKNIRDCDKKAPLAYMLFDMFLPPLQAEDIVTVRPGYWYGREMRYMLFDKEETGIEPDCFDADLVVRAIDVRVAATLPIRVVRTHKPPAPTDSGTEAPKPPGVNRRTETSPSETGVP